MQFVQATGLFIVAPILIAWLLYKNLWDFLRMRKGSTFLIFVLTALLTLAFLPVSTYLGHLNNSIDLPDSMSGMESWFRSMEESAATTTKAFLSGSSVIDLLVNLFLVALIPAVGEEMLFRGVFQRLFTEWFKNPIWGAAVAAFFFSAIHFQFYGFIPRFALGFMFGILLEMTGTLWVPVFAHFINNATGVIISFLVAKAALPAGAEEFGNTEGTMIYALPGVIISGLCFWLIARKRNRVL
jgi:membrane protease YdiL (CAAX protease family)